MRAWIRREGNNFYGFSVDLRLQIPNRNVLKGKILGVAKRNWQFAARAWRFLRVCRPDAWREDNQTEEQRSYLARISHYKRT